MKAGLSVCVLVATLTVAYAQDDFGKFSEFPQGEFILQEPRPIFRLTKDFVFRDENGVEWIAPKGESVDGASIPKPAWSFIGGPFEGRYLYAAIIHDHFSCAKSQDFVETQDIFWRAMRSTGVDSFKARYMWVAVRFLGLPSWVVESSKPVAKPCRAPDSQTATIFDQMNEADQKKAVAKLTALQKTLETSKGEVIDVVNGHVIEAGSDEAGQHIDRLREAAESGFAGADDLGLLTIPTEAELANPNLIEPWSSGDVVELDQYLTKNNLAAEYAATKQLRFEMRDVNALMPRLERLDLESVYERQ